MRVISGSAGGHSLKAPKGINTRPTTDRVKEAVFSMIMMYTEDAIVLDLFAGSGAMGIEALSRGAESCMFIDSDSNAVRTVKENLRAVKLLDKAKVHRNDALSALDIIIKKEIKFDIIILDPPYDLNILDRVLKIIEKSDIIKPEGIIVTEMKKNEKLTYSGNNLVLINEKVYGDTGIKIFRKQ